MQRSIKHTLLFQLGLTAGALTISRGALPAHEMAVPVERLAIKGDHFETGKGEPMRFWGVNLVAMYPPHAVSEHLAANLRNREINVVRLHHILRSSLDWNPVSKIPSLVTYDGDTRTPQADAWDRFDYLNAQLRTQGIYLLLSLHSSRRFLPGDVDIVTTDAADRAAWMAAMAALNQVKGNLDLFKILPVIDERCARLMEEFTQRLLTHQNPYTGRTYGADPQVLYLETLNEHSLEYAIVVGNKFENPKYPAVSYWKKALQAKWEAYTRTKGLAPCDLYAPATSAQKLSRGDFLRGLDEAFFKRMKAFVRGLGCRTPMEFSNLWRGDAFQKMEETLSDVIEEHDYADPLVARAPDDMFSYFSQSTPAGKPYFVGELNQAEPAKSLAANAPYRTMLPVAASAYGGFNAWSGITWFAWAHGDQKLGEDGWSRHEERRPSVDSDMIGEIESDGMMLDHLRTAGLVFKRGLVAPSKDVITWHADDPLGGTNYAAMMAPKYPFKAGWQNIHAIKRVYVSWPYWQPEPPWMTTKPTGPLVSDTGEIHKNIERQQLTVSAPQAEAFSGKLDGRTPDGLIHIVVGESRGSATLILVSGDGRPLSTSDHLIISRTYLDEAWHEIEQPRTALEQLKKPAEGHVWQFKRTRPRGEAKAEVLLLRGDELVLPTDGWHEGELSYEPVEAVPHP